MSEQPQLFETEDQYGNDIIQGNGKGITELSKPKIQKRKLTTKEAMIDKLVKKIQKNNDYRWYKFMEFR